MTVALFVARGLHHLVLVLAAAPALALAFPWPFRASGVTGFVGLSALLWLWHVPSTYEAAWNSVGLYWLMQAGLLLFGWMFWSRVLQTAETQERVSAITMVFALMGQMGLLGALLTFAPRVLYPQHADFGAAYGLDGLADQQLAGLVMWVPGMVPLAVLGAVLLRQGWRDLALR